MIDRKDQKRIEQAEYRAKLIEAELNAIKTSKSYQLSRMLGVVRSQIMSDPVGLSKKAASILLTNPTKAKHLLRSASRGSLIAQSITEQMAKYQEWILINEADEEELDQQRQHSDNLTYKPLISIITPVFNPPVDVLEKLIESVLEQTYGYFELCLGNFGDDTEVKELLVKYAKLDSRIRNWIFPENKGIAANSNKILQKVHGEYIALLDHDDTLAPNALYENVVLLNQKKCDFIYSDKDKIDEKGNRFDPLFKPEYSPEMMLNVNYLTHLNVIKTSVVKDVGGWDPHTDGAQDWDLFLRVYAATENVAHISKILYHWRVLASSTASSIEAKPYALQGQRNALDKYLKSQNIPAITYHKRTEVFLKWDNNSNDQNPLVFIYFSNFANYTRTKRTVSKKTNSPHFVILFNEKMWQLANLTRHMAGDDIITFKDDTELLQKIANYYAENPRLSAKSVLFISDNFRLTDKTWYSDLTGWLNIKKVGAVGGRVIDRKDLIRSSGGILTKDFYYMPLFNGFPRYYQSYIGNAEWVRNLTVLCPLFFVTKPQLLERFLRSQFATKEATLDNYFLWLSQSEGLRLVMTPHVNASAYEVDGFDPHRQLTHTTDLLSVKKDFQDPFGNPNMSEHDPMRLFDDERLSGFDEDFNSKEHLNEYSHDATILAATYDLTHDEFMANHKLIEQHDKISAHSVGWFLPSFDSIYAGLMNIFDFANYLQTQKGLRTTFFILKADEDVSNERAQVLEKFPDLATAKFVAIKPNQTDLPATDIGICTLWSTAFVLAKYNKVKRKCYFIQDNETNFYPKGSISALVDLSYRFGFYAIANTQGLLDLYKTQYDGTGVVVTSKVNLNAYRPRKDLYYVPAKPYKVFFYARPNMPRNAFELGIAGLKVLKTELGDEVEIITAGAEWDASAYGVEGLFSNLGKIAYKTVPKLYRSVDAGLMFMFSGHPGVTASELMASGCPVVVNDYDDITWHELYEDEETCLITLPIASEIARNLLRCLQDDELRKKLINGGLVKTKGFYSGYETSLKQAYEAIEKGRHA